MNQKINYDFIIIGGGIFGCYTALYLAKKNYKICIIEKENQLFTKASVVNQARLHSGYHYPRSYSTAIQANQHKERFTSEHKQFINSEFTKYYAIGNHTSFTHAHRFEEFCNYIKIPLKKVKSHPLINLKQMEALYEAEEYSFDPILLKNYYENQILSNSNIDVFFNAKIDAVKKEPSFWEIKLSQENNIKYFTTNFTINATYSGINAINNLFKIDEKKLIYELTEVCLIKSESLKNIGLTIMDGAYASTMPYGLSALHSLTSVQYTPHEASHHSLPTFSCQKHNNHCSPNYISDCKYCPVKPKTNYTKMINQLNNFLIQKLDNVHVLSYFTIKTISKGSMIDDSRFTHIEYLSQNPYYLNLFSGKINSIYEVEKILNHV